MHLSDYDISLHNDIEHELNSVAELQAQFSQSIEQLTQAFQTYEGAPNLNPSYMRHMESAVNDLNQNNQNLLKYLQTHQQGLSEQLSLDNQNQKHDNTLRNNTNAAINLLHAQVKSAQLLISLFLHSLRAQRKLQKQLQEQKEQINALQQQKEIKEQHKRHEQQKERLNEQAKIARLTPFYTQPKPYPR